MKAKRSISVKALVLLLAVVLLVGGVVGGTVAYLMAKTPAVTNTFVAGDIGSLTLTETTGDSYMVIPGVDIEKDPVVEFEGNNVAAYVFLQIGADGWTVSASGTGYTYSIADKMSWTLEGWTQLEAGVYYKEVAAGANAQSWPVITGNTITVSSEITKDDIADYTKALTFTAYAIQKDSFESVAKAWAQAKTQTA